MRIEDMNRNKQNRLKQRIAAKSFLFKWSCYINPPEYIYKPVFDWKWYSDIGISSALNYFPTKSKSIVTNITSVL